MKVKEPQGGPRVAKPSGTSTGGGTLVSTAGLASTGGGTSAGLASTGRGTSAGLPCGVATTDGMLCVGVAACFLDGALTFFFNTFTIFTTFLFCPGTTLRFQEKTLSISVYQQKATSQTSLW